MGVKYLWGIIDPVCKEKPVGELFGKRLAIDTSCWVVSDNQLLPSHIAKPHLRNLFFRTASLLNNGIDPVYVLEGQAPELKAAVMRKRVEARYGASQQGSGAKEHACPARSRYHHVQKECAELLSSLGVVTITSRGEAEAGCAGLNLQGAVDGCITVDGDTFLYGAKTVYRHLSTDTSHFTCQEYTMDMIESRLNLTRDKLIALAILFGCDYLPDGVPGVGRESALRVISTWKNGSAREILKSWVSDEERPEEEACIPPRPAHCSQCKHPGSLRNHAKFGCPFCLAPSGCNQSDTRCPCDWHTNEVRYEEMSIRAKVASMKALNIDAIFDEFRNDAHMTQYGGPIPSWRMPAIGDFLQIATKKLKWEASYAAEKILPLLSRWFVIHGRGCKDELPVVPLRVLKKRIKRGCPLYEVEWRFCKQTDHFPVCFQTLEPQFLIEKNFGHLLPRPVPRPAKKPKGRNKGAVGVAEPKEPKGLREPAKSQGVVDMFQKMKLKSKRIESPSMSSARSPPPPRSTDTSLLDLTEDVDDSDLSMVVQMICDRRNGVILKSEGPVQTELSNPTATVEHNHAAADRLKTHRLPNFSLNFSLTDLLETNLSIRDSLKPNPSAASTSTPERRACEVVRTEEHDSFSTPPPLADRFSRLCL